MPYRMSKGRYDLRSGTGADIQSAVNQAHADGGGTVVLGGTEFTVSQTITLPSDIRLIGQGRATVLKQANAANTDIIHVTNQDVWDVGEEISHMTIHGNRANNTAGRGVVVWPFSLRFHLHDLHVRECVGNGVHYVNDPNSTDGIWEPIITQSQIEDCDGNGLVLEQNCPDLYLANSSATQCQDGFVLGSGGHSLMHAHATTNRGNGFVFDNCNRSWAIDAYGDTNDGHGLYILNSTNLTFVGGRAMKSGTATTPKDGVHLESSYSNRFFGMGMDDPQATKTQRYGVNEGTTASGNFFVGCNFLNNMTGGFNGSMSTKHVANEGHNTVATGVWSGTGDGTTQTFNAGTFNFGTNPDDPGDVIITASGANYESAYPVPDSAFAGYGANGIEVAYIRYNTPPADGQSLRAKWKAEILQ